MSKLIHTKLQSSKSYVSYRQPGARRGRLNANDEWFAIVNRTLSKSTCTFFQRQKSCSKKSEHPVFEPGGFSFRYTFRKENSSESMTQSPSAWNQMIRSLRYLQYSVAAIDFGSESRLVFESTSNQLFSVDIYMYVACTGREVYVFISRLSEERQN